MAEDWAPTGIDTQTPSTARMYDYYLGGKHHYPADREVAELLIEKFPQARHAARINRSFLTRVVRYMADSGINQFLDLGAGLPTQQNVHEVAQVVNPDARVAYIDHDPVTLAHGQALLATDPQTAVVDADLRDPGQVLGHPRVEELIDFDEPVGVLCVAVLHFVTDEEGPAGIVGAYRDAVPGGSQVAMSVANSDDAGPEMIAAVKELYRNASSPMVLRTREQIRTFFDGLDLVEPGVVDVPGWRPNSAEEASAERDNAGAVGVAALGRKP